MRIGALDQMFLYYMCVGVGGWGTWVYIICVLKLVNQFSGLIYIYIYIARL
jgi:hypothetical protein